MRPTTTSSAFALIVALLMVAPARGDLLETFDPVTVPATAVQGGTAPGPLVLPAESGSTGDFLRLINYGVNNNRNLYVFDQTDVGGFPTIVAEFDFRASNTANPADGFSLRFIPTWVYGTTGPGTPSGTGIEEPNIADVFAIGIDLYPEGDPRNDVSVHWDGSERVNVTIPPATLDLNSGQFHRARVEWDNLGGASNVSVSIIPDINGTPGTPYDVVTNLFIPGLSPYDHRIELAARTGGATVDFDVDNVNVAYTAPSLQFFQDFDGGGTPGTLSQDNTAPGPQNQGPDAGSTGQFLRLINNGVNGQNNSIAFDQAAEQQLNSPGGMATFDFRCSDDGAAEADGFAMVFLPTSTYGVTGPGAGFTAEEPNVPGALAVGFDFHPQGDGVNDVSVHWDGVQLVNVEVPRSVLDLNTNQFHQAQVRWTPDDTGTNVSVWVVPDINGTPGDPIGVVGGIHVPIDGLYSHRVQFRGRTGGLNMDVDLDNIDADYAVVQPPPGPGFFQDFDSPGTTLYSVQGHLGGYTGSGPVVRPPDAGSTGYFMQLLTDGINSQRNSIAFDQVEEQLLGEPYNIVTFDFRATNKSNPADGFSMLFLPTSLYGTTGPGAPTAGWVPEEPNVPGVLAIGFDLYPNQNDVSVHWNGAELLNVDVPPGVLDLNSGQFHQAQVVWTTKDGASNVRVSIIPDINGTPGDPIDIVSGLHVPAIGRYSHRIEFTGRTGGLNFGLDIDNMAAQYVEDPREFDQDFDDPTGTAYTVTQLGSSPGPIRLPGDAGSTGGFLRLTNDGVNSQHNAIAFDQAWNQSAPYPTNVVNIVDFDFRATSVDAPADGFSMLFLPSEIYGTAGPGAAGTFGPAEEPNIPDVLAIGFDLYPSATVNDISVHWDNAELLNLTLPDSDIDLDAGVFHHAMVRWEGIPGGSLVTVSLIPDINGLIGAEVTPVVEYYIPGLDAYPYRLEFVGRTGGLNMSIDLDNITVLFLPEPASFTLCGLGLLALARRRREQA